MDEARLLAEVVADPTNLAPRLVYADALLEAGDPRGELIQLQIALDELDRDDPRYAEVERRAGDLLGLHETAWTRELRARTRLTDHVHQLRFRRGFVERARLAAREVAAMLPVLRAATPLRELVLWARDGFEQLERVPDLVELEAISIPGAALETPRADSFARWPHRGRLRSLEVSGTAAAHAIAVTPALAGLERLRLSWPTVDGSQSLARAAHLASVRRVELQNTTLDGSGLDMLASSALLAGAEELDLGETRLGGHGATTLCAAVRDTLRVLRVHDAKSIGEAGARAIAELSRLEVLDAERAGLGKVGVLQIVTAGLPALRHLDVSRNGLSALASVLDQLALPALTRLACADDALGPGIARAIAEAPALDRVRELDLSRNELGDDGVIALARAPRLGALEELDLAMTDCGPRGLAALGSGALGARLRRLDLAGNRIGDDGIAALLAGALPRLAVLDLGRAGLTASGMRALVDSPVAGHLESLTARGLAEVALAPLLAGALPELRTLVVDAFDDRAAAALAAARGLPMLRYVVLTAPRLTDAGARVLAGARGLERLEWLEVGASEVSDRGRAALQARFQHHVGVFDSATLHVFGTLSRRF